MKIASEDDYKHPNITIIEVTEEERRANTFNELKEHETWRKLRQGVMPYSHCLKLAGVLRAHYMKGKKEKITVKVQEKNPGQEEAG